MGCWDQLSQDTLNRVIDQLSNTNDGYQVEGCPCFVWTNCVITAVVTFTVCLSEKLDKIHPLLSVKFSIISNESTIYTNYAKNI